MNQLNLTKIKNVLLNSYSTIIKDIHTNSLYKKKNIQILKKKIRKFLFKEFSVFTELKSIIIDNDEELSINPKNNLLLSIQTIDNDINAQIDESFGSTFCLLDLQKKQSNSITGRNIILSGYVFFGIISNLILAISTNVSIYKYNHKKSEFTLYNSNYKIPKKGLYYFTDESNKQYWSEYYIHQLLDKLRSNWNQKYTRSIVTDFHNILMNGGILIYPKSQQFPNGLINILNESYPLSFIMKNAGGTNSNGLIDTLDLPYSVVKNTSFIIGSEEEMKLLYNILNPDLLYFD